jgi:hypothetical protein
MANLLKLSDFGLVAALITKGYEPASSEQEGRRISYLFEDNGGLLEVIEKYNTNDLMVDAFEYAEVMRTLRRSIYQRTSPKNY